MRKTGLFLSLLMAMTCFSQTIKISGNEDNSKFRFETSASGHALTGFIYSKIKSFDNGGFGCSLADTILKGNFTLLDSSLKTIIPYGLFSEIILSEDGNYATVAGEEYTILQKENSYDTITIARKTKDWGVYEIKSKKLILPIKYNYLSMVYKDGKIVFNKGGLSYMNDTFGQGGLFGITNLKGEEICKAKYTYIGSYNIKDIALAVIGGDNMDGVNYGDVIAIDKKGENIKPNFYIEPSPLVMKVSVDNDNNQHLLYLKEIESLMGFKNETDTLTRDSLFNTKYIADSYEENFSEFTSDGYENFVARTAYEIYEKDSKVDIWKPLPSNLKYYYDPNGSSIKNWGKHLRYKTSTVPLYQVFSDKVNVQIASFCSIDSIYAAEYDSLEIDFMYPGIYEQNKKVLDKKFGNDLRSKKVFYEKLNEQGFIFKNSWMDTLSFNYKLACDTVETNMTICRNCSNEDSRFASKYFYKKHMGLLVNEEVILPPIYNYIVYLSESEYLLLDTINNLWNYHLTSNTLNRSNLIFDKIVNRSGNVEENPYTESYLLVTKNADKKFIAYGIETVPTVQVFDSARVISEASGIDMNGNEVVYTAYQDFNSMLGYGDPVTFRSDSAFNYNIKENSITFKDRIKNLFPRMTNGGNLELVNSSINFNKLRYRSYYYQRGFYLLETLNKKYLLSNGSFFTSNSIKLDSVKQIHPHVIYYRNNKMFLATYKSKTITVQNKQVTKYFITPIDSAKQLELVGNYDTYDYDNIETDLYKADGIYKSISSKKVVKYVPTNFKGDVKEEVLMFAYDDKKWYVLGRTDYIISKNSAKYLCALRDAEIKKDEVIEDMVIEYRDKYYEVLDSAKVFDIPKVKDKYDCKYDIRGTYRADGVLKSATTNKKLPIQTTDSIIAFSSNKEEVELFAFCKNGKWKVLCVNMVNSEEFIILDEYVFSSFQSLLKTLRPFQESSIDCDIKTPSKTFDKILSNLDKKAMDGVPWK